MKTSTKRRAEEEQEPESEGESNDDVPIAEEESGSNHSEEDIDRDDIEEDDFTDNDDNDEQLHVDDDAIDSVEPVEKKKAVLPPLNPKALAKFQAKVDRSGILYISRVPPFMKHSKLRSLLSQYSKHGLGRIYLAPEDPKIAARRRKYKGNRRENFTEGWVEFVDKTEAKTIAGMLNGKIIGGKKRDRYYDDTWTLKYLPKFKWTHLNEQIAYERAVRAQKLQAEMQQARRENKAYLANVGKAKMLEAIKERKARKGGVSGSQPKDEGDDESPQFSSTAELRRQFRQRKPIDPDAKMVPTNGVEKKSAVLRKLFAGADAQ